jgi:hypothetical protein
MTEKITVTVENDTYKGDFPAQEIQVKEYIEGESTLVTVEEDGTRRLHKIEDVKKISVD